jgi:hypothetical protein
MKPSKLQSVPLSELEAEIRRRQDQERAKREALANKRRSQLLTLLAQPGAVDALAPQHGRTTCTDEDRRNGVYGEEIPRCNRCALLDIQECPEAFPANLVLSVEFSLGVSW